MDQIEKLVKESVDQLVKTAIETRLAELVENRIMVIIRDQLDRMVPKLVNDRIGDCNIEETAKLQTQDMVNKIVNNILDHEVRKGLSKIDLNHHVKSLVEEELVGRMENFVFPNSSISALAIDWSTAHHHIGELMHNEKFTSFKSSGIIDKASSQQLTILDDSIVAENRIVARHGQFEKDLVIKGDLAIGGEINRDSKFYLSLLTDMDKIGDKISEKVDSEFNRLGMTITDRGVDVLRIHFHGKPLIENNSLHTRVVDSNIQSVGVLKELQVKGEALISDTLYVSQSDRVGINTIEPSSVLSVWDEEVELVMRKQSKHTGFIGTIRDTDLTIGRNGKIEITIGTSGVQVEKININGSVLSSVNAEPNFPGNTGDILFNRNATDYAGWICLGGTRWARFGKLE